MADWIDLKALNSASLEVSKHLWVIRKLDALLNDPAVAEVARLLYSETDDVFDAELRHCSDRRDKEIPWLDEGLIRYVTFGVWIDAQADNKWLQDTCRPLFPKGFRSSPRLREAACVLYVRSLDFLGMESVEELIALSTPVSELIDLGRRHFTQASPQPIAARLIALEDGLVAVQQQLSDLVGGMSASQDLASRLGTMLIEHSVTSERFTTYADDTNIEQPMTPIDEFVSLKESNIEEGLQRHG